MTMDKNSFQPERRYTITLRDDQGRQRPANIFVYRTYEAFMVVRFVGGDGLLRKLRYESVERIVKEWAPDPDHVFNTPAALLDENTWRDREVMQHYATSPGLGK